MMLSSVDLPEPDGPRMANQSPGQMVRLTSRNAWTGASPPKVRETPMSSTTGWRSGEPGPSTGMASASAPPAKVRRVSLLTWTDREMARTLRVPRHKTDSIAGETRRTLLGGAAGRTRRSSPGHSGDQSGVLLPEGGLVLGGHLVLHRGDVPLLAGDVGRHHGDLFALKGGQR